MHAETVSILLLIRVLFASLKPIFSCGRIFRKKVHFELGTEANAHYTLLFQDLILLGSVRTEFVSILISFCTVDARDVNSYFLVKDCRFSEILNFNTLV
jgi:hypothetical protein